MRFWRRLSVLVLTVGVLVGCTEEAGTRIVVSVEEGIPENGQLVLFKLTTEGLTPADTFDVASDGNFELKLDVEETGFYRVDIARQNFMNLILDGSESLVEVEISKENKSVVGSLASETVSKIDQRAAEHQVTSNQINQSGMKAMQEGDAVEIEKLRNDFLTSQEDFKSDVKGLLDESSNVLASLYGLNYLDMDQEYEFFYRVVSRAEEDLGVDHFWVSELRANLDAMSKLAIGQPAPDFELPSPSGELIALSDLRGKYVLIDFWAAWCRPCRQENPNVVRAYNEYQDENFEILGVSLDRTREAWVKAIEDDGLPWLHVSDLKYYDSEAARLYNINFIPATYLIDPEGNIIDKNLRGPSLDDKLAELFGES